MQGPKGILHSIASDEGDDPLGVGCACYRASYGYRLASPALPHESHCLLPRPHISCCISNVMMIYIIIVIPGRASAKPCKQGDKHQVVSFNIPEIEGRLVLCMLCPWTWPVMARPPIPCLHFPSPKEFLPLHGHLACR
jgi:hypothetical protein